MTIEFILGCSASLCFRFALGLEMEQDVLSNQPLFLLFLCSSGGRLILTTNYVSLQGDTVIVESGGLIDSSGHGYSAGSGPGSGSGSTGGSYASPGGRASSGNQYGSLYWPYQPGSGGGYGAGGGWLYIVTGNTVVVEGTIRSNGIGSSSTSNGGGSGGAVVVNTLFLKGYGTIECHGGLSK